MYFDLMLLINVNVYSYQGPAGEVLVKQVKWKTEFHVEFYSLFISYLD